MPSCANHPDAITGLAVCSTCGGTFCPSCFITLQGRTICAGCKGGAVQDIKSNVSDDSDLASNGARFAAQFIDSLIVGVAILLLTMGIGRTGGGLGTLMLLSIVVVPLLLWSAYEALLLQHGGQTLGKMVCKIKVVSADGGDLRPGQCWSRAVSRILLQITRIGGIIDAVMIFSQKRATLHDRIAKTRVVNWQR